MSVKIVTAVSTYGLRAWYSWVEGLMAVLHSISSEGAPETGLNVRPGILRFSLLCFSDFQMSLLMPIFVNPREDLGPHVSFKITLEEAS